MQTKIVITHRVHDEVRERLSRYATVIVNEGTDSWPQEHLLTQLADATAVMTFMPDRFDESVLVQAPQLRLVACALKGFDNFDVSACSARGIYLSIVQDLLTEPTAELTIGLMIGLGRHMLTGDATVRSAFHGWRPTLYGTGLKGNRIGILGMGAIGQAIAERLTGFGAVTTYWDRKRLNPEAEKRLAVTWTEFDELVASARFLVCALPLSQETQHLVNAQVVAAMPKGALLINPARGGLVDEAAVAAALETGHLGGYAADVFEMEDWARDDRPRAIHPGLLQRPASTLLTPHLGSAVSKTRLAIEHEAASNIIDLLEGRTPRGAINQFPPRTYKEESLG